MGNSRPACFVFRKLFSLLKRVSKSTRGEENICGQQNKLLRWAVFFFFDVKEALGLGYSAQSMLEYVTKNSNMLCLAGSNPARFSTKKNGPIFLQGTDK